MNRKMMKLKNSPKIIYFSTINHVDESLKLIFFKHIVANG